MDGRQKEERATLCRRRRGTGNGKRRKLDIVGGGEGQKRQFFL